MKSSQELYIICQLSMVDVVAGGCFNEITNLLVKQSLLSEHKKVQKVNKDISKAE
jgi:hypothetical protein